MSSFLVLPSTLGGLVEESSGSVDCLCFGSGRFLRSVLVPALVGAGLRPAILQTRGRSFLEYCSKRGSLEYEVDTVGRDGVVSTEHVPCYGAGTLGSSEGTAAAFDLISKMKSISVIGVGVTEGGLSSASNQAMVNLAALLRHVMKMGVACENPNGKICIINTDNVPNNGSVIFHHMMELAKEKNDDAFVEFLKNRVTFHNTMVDRITSQRPDSDGMVPRCEPVPAKACVVEDLDGDLPPNLTTPELKQAFGWVVRSQRGELSCDIALKLRVANGTHTAAAHVMALVGLTMTDALSSKSDGGATLILVYLDALFQTQILPAATPDYGKAETKAVYEDWRRRLCHAHFGLSTFFITQNGAAKGGIRIAPTIRSLLAHNNPVTASTVYAVAAILRFLTPIVGQGGSVNGIYRGWLDGAKCSTEQHGSSPEHTVTYADGLQYNLEEQWYEFRCSCKLALGNSSSSKPIPELLEALSFQQPEAYEEVVRHYLTQSDGGNMPDLATSNPTQFRILVCAVCTLLARMVNGDGMLNLLQEMHDESGVYSKGGFGLDCAYLVDGLDYPGSPDDTQPLHYRPSPIPETSNILTIDIGIDPKVIESLVFAEVSSAHAIDLHTHLLPPSHGPLCLWGIDELLTYHYLVAEYFITAPASMSPEVFYALDKKKQADIIWKALFLDRLPVSEACRGIVTTLKAFGLGEQLKTRDLDAVREYYESFRSKDLEGAEKFSAKVFECAGVRYAIMTNIPFDANEAKYWRPKRKEYPDQFRSALRVDPLLAGDRETIEKALRASGYEVTLEGARKYLRDWCDTMKPEYMMASTPHNFVLSETKGTLSGIVKTGVNPDALRQPFAFVGTSGVGCNPDCDPEEENTASIIDENSDFLSEVLMKICEERDLPVALKIGAHRGVNPELLSAGDGVVAFADTSVLARLCSRFPKVRFLATFLSKNNQHEACVLASKFRNLHIYGCWWFCNNPSIITEITTMRVEMLGSAFTAQHSDARVLDQLIYKWSHSRAVIAKVLSKEFTKLVISGWSLTRGELRREVERLFGGSYEEFMAKSLK